MELGAKLQMKPGQSVAVLLRPAGLQLDLPEGTDEVKDAGKAEVVVAFVQNSAALSKPAVAKALDAAREDRLTWLLYPKAGQLNTDLNRDRLADAMRGNGVRPVRQVSVDEVWSALRFRPE